MKNTISISILFLSLLFPTSLFCVENINNISIKSAVIFNILCAKCHEGQCSGRLSFDTGSEAASNHIKRYANNKSTSKTEIEEFFTLLNYMKKECLLIMPKNIKDKKNNFSLFALKSNKGYFIPLGILKKGDYDLIIKTQEKDRFTLEIISDSFETSLEKTICLCSKRQTYNFAINKTLNYFLRIKSRKPLHITTLEVKPKL